MTSKHVSIRLAAIGGKQVKAEFEGVGKSAKRGFGKASREIEIANAKLAKFARRAKIASGIMVAAAVSAGVVLVKSSLTTIDAQAKLAASLGTTTASIQILTRAADLAGVSQGEVEQATIMMTKSLSQAAQGTGPAVKALKALHLTAAGLSKLTVDQKMIKIQDAIAKFVPAAEQAAVAAQIFGARAGLIFTRIDSATIRQARQDVKDFGVETSKIDAAQIQTTNDALSRMGLLWTGIGNQLSVAVAPALQSAADTFARFGKTTGPLGRTLKILGDRLGEISTIAVTFATFMAGRFVFAMGAAALGVMRVVTSLGLVRGALTRTGLGAIAVLVGELVFRYDLLGASAETTATAQDKLNKALNLYSTTHAPEAKQAALEAAQAIQAQAAATLAAAQADVAALELKIAISKKQANNRLSAGFSKGRLTFQKKQLVEMNTMLFALSVKLDDAKAQVEAVSKKGEGIAPPIATAVTASNSLGTSLSIAKAHAAGLVAAFASTGAALQGMKNQAEILDAALAVAARGGSAAAISSAKFRKQKELELGLSEAQGAAEKSYINDIINRSVAEHAANAARQKALDKYLATLGKIGGGKSPLTILPPKIPSTDPFKNYAHSIADIGSGLSDVLVNSFKSVEDVFNQFTRTGKINFRSFASSIIADMARMQFRRGVLKPISTALSGLFGGGGSNGGHASATAGTLGSLFSGPLLGGLFHTGGLVGAGGPSRAVPAAVFANAPRMHSGGFAGLRPDEVPAILQRGERVLSRREVATGAGGGSQTSVHISLAPGLEAQILDKAQGQSVQVTNDALDIYDRHALPGRVNEIAKNPMVTG